MRGCGAAVHRGGTHSRRCCREGRGPGRLRFWPKGELLQVFWPVAPDWAARLCLPGCCSSPADSLASGLCGASCVNGKLPSISLNPE